MFKMSIYYIAEVILAPVLRQERLLAFLFSLCKPLEDLYNEFEAFVAEMRFENKFTGQVCYIEKRLNLSYDVPLERIRVTDNGFRFAPDFFTYSDFSSEPMEVGYADGDSKMLWYNTSTQTNDYTITIPIELSAEEGKIQTLANQYKPLGKKFNIQIQ